MPQRMTQKGQIIYEKICKVVDYKKLADCLRVLNFRKNSNIFKTTFKQIIYQCLQKGEMSIEKLYTKYFTRLFTYEEYFRFLSLTTDLKIHPYFDLVFRLDFLQSRSLTNHKLIESKMTIYGILAYYISINSPYVKNIIDRIFERDIDFKNLILRYQLNNVYLSSYNSRYKNEIKQIEDEYKNHLQIIPYNLIDSYGDNYRYNLNIISHIYSLLSNRILIGMIVRPSEIDRIYRECVRGDMIDENKMNKMINNIVRRLEHRYLENLIRDYEIEDSKREIKEEKIKSHLYTKKDEGQCSICFDEFVEGDQISTTQCKHSFHRDCIGDWYKKNPKSCPLCRQEMVPFSFK